MSDTWVEQFSDLAVLSAEDKKLLSERAAQVSLPAGTTVFAPGGPAESFMLVLEGTIRVQQVSPSGREIVLYRVTGGDSCILTTSCLFSGEAYLAEGVTETDVEAIAIPKAAFEEAIARSSGFRQLVFADYSDRISDIMHVVQEVAFERLDKRLAQRLLALAGTEDVVKATHQDLAAELGSAREVVSRQLKELQRRGWISVSRGEIALTRRDDLERLAASE